MQLMFELHFAGLCIGVIHLHQCIPKLAWVILHLEYA
jgi:hypothetical protein